MPGMEWFWVAVLIFVLAVVGLTVGHKDDDDDGPAEQ